MSSRHPHLVGLVALVVAGVVLAVGTATAATGRPAEALKADGLRLQGMAQVYERMQGLTADGLRLQGIAQAYEQLQGRPAASFYTPQALEAQALRWQGMAQAYAADATAAGSSSASSNGFDWGAAFIGAASMLGLATVGVALLFGAHRVRRTKVAV